MYVFRALCVGVHPRSSRGTSIRESPRRINGIIPAGAIVSVDEGVL